MLRPRLVKDWRRAHRWLSMRFLGVAAALQTAFMAMPDDLREAIPDHYKHGIALALLVCAVLGRLVDQGDNDVRKPAE